jgi:hypothetical protein
MTHEVEPANTEVAARESNPSVVSRRGLFRVAVATAPLIATLPSGAALARSSNMISGTTAGDARDQLNRTLCLDRNSGVRAYRSRIDLGAPPSGNLTAIKERDYRSAPKLTATRVSEGDMCQNGGYYHYMSNGQWKKVSVPRGMMVSATALSSFAGHIYTTEI